MAKKLIAFDFDHTIVDLNTDLHVKKLAPNGKLPEEIEEMFSLSSWTNYMGSIFKYLHSIGVKESDMRQCMAEIPLTKGMDELLSYTTSQGWENIIISDSNSMFIKYILNHEGLDSTFSDVYTNPAHFDENGLLNIEYYHTQDWCDLSTVNLCKGHILNEHIKMRQSEGVEFSQILYVGDGTNDLCPSLKLSESDIVYPRIDFRLWKKIKKLKANDNVDEKSGSTLVIKADICEWENGLDILNHIKSLK